MFDYVAAVLFVFLTGASGGGLGEPNVIFLERS